MRQHFALALVITLLSPLAANAGKQQLSRSSLLVAEVFKFSEALNVNESWSSALPIRRSIVSSVAGESRPILPVLMSSTSVASGTPEPSPRGSVDWILVLDTSASMHGADGAADIFGRVQETLSNFIRSTRENDSVTLYTFDRDAVLRSSFRITGDSDREDLVKIVKSLRSDGDRTYLGKALHDALERARQLEGDSRSSGHTIAIVLFTDGREDVRGLPPPIISIPSNISLVPKSPPYVFYVSLGGAGQHEESLADLLKDPAMQNRGKVIIDPEAKKIAEEMDTIRASVESPPAPKNANLRAEPKNLNFGQVEPGKASTKQTLRISSDAAMSVNLRIGSQTNAGLLLVQPTGSIDVKAGGETSLDVAIQPSSGATNGIHPFTLVLTPVAAQGIVANPVSVPATVEIQVVPLWRKSLKWFGLLIILLVLAVIAFSVIRLEPPWIWIPELVGELRPRLEGDIEIIHPRQPRLEDEFVPLTQKKLRTVQLSTLVPGGTGDSDAELQVTKKDGQLATVLRRTIGEIFVNKVEVATTCIYDGDIIELGGVRLRFNWNGHERPEELLPDSF